MNKLLVNLLLLSITMVIPVSAMNIIVARAKSLDVRIARMQEKTRTVRMKAVNARIARMKAMNRPYSKSIGREFLQFMTSKIGEVRDFMESTDPSQVMKRHMLQAGVLSAAFLSVYWKYRYVFVGVIGLLGAINVTVLAVTYPYCLK
jgi:hypothetical protein